MICQWQCSLRPSPKQDVYTLNKTASKSGTSSTSFQDFQASVSDAWDLDDDEFSIISGLNGKFRYNIFDMFYFNLFLDTKISKKVSHSAALNVINTHRSKLTDDVNQQPDNKDHLLQKCTVNDNEVESHTEVSHVKKMDNE